MDNILAATLKAHVVDIMFSCGIKHIMQFENVTLNIAILDKLEQFYLSEIEIVLLLLDVSVIY